MTVLQYIVTSIFAVVALALIALVLMQEGKSAGLGTIGGMSDTFWEKNKARSKEGMLENISKVLAVLFLVLAFALVFLF